MQFYAKFTLALPMFKPRMLEFGFSYHCLRDLGYATAQRNIARIICRSSPGEGTAQATFACHKYCRL